MSEELGVLKAVTGRLDAAGIPYMVTGSIAVNFYALPRMTRDIDLVVELAEWDIDRIVVLFQQDFHVDRELVEHAVRGHTMFNMIQHALVMKVDMIVRKESEYRREEFARKRRVSVEGHEFYIVAPEDLILSKLDWAKDTHSEVQLTDVRNLLQTVQGLDTRYLREWADRVGVGTLLTEVGG